MFLHLSIVFCEKSSHRLKCEIISHIITLGEHMRNLKEYRTRMGKTQKDVAAYLGIERSTYAKYENGSSEPTFETLRRLSEYFGASVDEMMGIARDEKEPAPTTPSNERKLDERQIMAAFWGGDQDLTEEDKKAMWADVKNFAAFVAQQKKQEKQRND